MDSKIYMDPSHILALKESLIGPCEEGDDVGIGEIVKKAFLALPSPKGIFCATNPIYERKVLPARQTFRGKGTVHGFMSSNRLMFAGGRRSFTFTIALDSNVVSYIRRRVEGRAQSGIDDALTECISFLGSHRSAINAQPYLFENFDRLSSPDVLDTVLALARLQDADQAELSSGRVKCISPESDILRARDAMIMEMGAPHFQTISGHAKQRWKVCYTILLAATAVHFEGPRKSAKHRTHALVEFLHEELKLIPEQEVYFAYRFFSRGSQERFFRPIQRNVTELFTRLKGMAWDLAFHRTTPEMALAAGMVEGHAAHVVPYLLTFDEAAIELLKDWRANGWITYFTGKSAGYVLIQPMEFYQAVSDVLYDSSDRFFTPEAIAKRTNKFGGLSEADADRVLALAEERLRSALA
jgi:hypothetical protein